MALFIILISNLIMSVIASRTITAPIKKLSDGANEIAGGNLDYHIDYDSTNEIGTTVKSINDMTEKLKALMQTKEEIEQSRKKMTAGIAHDLGKACIIAVNKWDAVEKDGKTMDSYRKKLMIDFSFMSYAPIIFISAKTGQRVEKLYELINYVHEQHGRRVSTGVLNDVLADATMKVQPPTDKGKRLRIYYVTQVSVKPPTFVIFVNDKELAHFSYVRYLEKAVDCPIQYVSTGADRESYIKMF